jgi:YfiH family protein
VTPLWFEPDWPAPKRVRALSSLRGAPATGGASQGPYAWLNLGAHVGDDPEAVAANRRLLRSRAGLPAEPSWLAQVHGVTVADLDAADLDAAGLDAAGLDAAGSPGPADAAITRRVGKVCAILTADCLPIVFTTDTGDGVAAAHAGWRGLAAGVIGATVRAMAVPPERLMAWLGPAIGPAHFEVGAEVREAFLRTDPGAGDAFKATLRGKFMADLAMLARRQLKGLGVSRIYGGGDCTYAHTDRYFSHRRDGVTGRQATLIWREGS